MKRMASRNCAGSTLLAVRRSSDASTATATDSRNPSVNTAVGVSFLRSSGVRGGLYPGICARKARNASNNHPCEALLSKTTVFSPIQPRSGQSGQCSHRKASCFRRKQCSICQSVHTFDEWIGTMRQRNEISVERLLTVIETIVSVSICISPKRSSLNAFIDRISLCLEWMQCLADIERGNWCLGLNDCNFGRHSQYQ